MIPSIVQCKVNGNYFTSSIDVVISMSQAFDVIQKFKVSSGSSSRLHCSAMGIPLNNSRNPTAAHLHLDQRTGVRY